VFFFSQWIELPAINGADLYRFDFAFFTTFLACFFAAGFCLADAFVFFLAAFAPPGVWI